MTPRGDPAAERARAAVAATLARTLLYAGIVLLLAGCVPIGVRVQNMLALWSG